MFDESNIFSVIIIESRVSWKCSVLFSSFINISDGLILPDIYNTLI